MAVTASDIVIYGSDYMQESDSGLQGGGIDVTTRVVFEDSSLANGPSGLVSIVSTEAGDTDTVRVTGRLTTGSISGEVLTLNGTVSVTGTNVFNSILKVSGQTHVGTITVRDTGGPTDIASLAPSVNIIRRPFYDVAAGDAERLFYEKVFIKNNSTTNSLLSAQISESGGGDPESVVSFDLNANINGTDTSASRRTAPSGAIMQGSPTFDSDAKSLTNDTNLGTGQAIGVWLLLTLAADASATKTTYTLTTSGNTTA